MSEVSPQRPLDPDQEFETAQPSQRPLHLRPSSIAVVFLGGAVGTGLREALSLAFPPLNGVPWAIFGINIVGAFLLGLLLESLARRGPDVGQRRLTRLLLGTGVMGGFTTYSALAADTASLIGSGRSTMALAYGIATVVIGALATWAGIAAGVSLSGSTDAEAGR